MEMIGSPEGDERTGQMRHPGRTPRASSGSACSGGRSMRTSSTVCRSGTSARRNSTNSCSEAFVEAVGSCTGVSTGRALPENEIDSQLRYTTPSHHERRLVPAQYPAKTTGSHQGKRSRPAENRAGSDLSRSPRNHAPPAPKSRNSLLGGSIRPCKHPIRRLGRG